MGYQALNTPNDAKNYVNEAGQIEWGAIPLNAALDKLKATREGLSSSEAQRRLIEYGPNALPKVEVNRFMVFLGFMWNPL
ncbi:P-type ATPase (P-ATPase) Superfamily, partial [Thraustotheca clavata]